MKRIVPRTAQVGEINDNNNNKLLNQEQNKTTAQTKKSDTRDLSHGHDSVW